MSSNCRQPARTPIVPLTEEEMDEEMSIYMQEYGKDEELKRERRSDAADAVKALSDERKMTLGLPVFGGEEQLETEEYETLAREATKRRFEIRCDAGSMEFTCTDEGSTMYLYFKAFSERFLNQYCGDETCHCFFRYWMKDGTQVMAWDTPRQLELKQFEQIHATLCCSRSVTHTSSSP